MTRDEVRAKIKGILVELLEVDDDELSDGEETELMAGLGADDLDVVEIALAIEEEFDFNTFDDEQIRERTTIGELVDLVMDQLESGRSR